MTTPDISKHVVIVGAGPAGLTAAYELARYGYTCDILESDIQVGGISRTVERDGWRFDLGGHRFFTKVERVNSFWHEILPDGDFLLRPRMSRIYYNGKYFDYPLRALNALRNLGLVEAILCVASYVRVRIFPIKDTSNFEGWVANRFGWRLYRTFFKTYTEKVWGIPANRIQADWAAQRIKNLSLARAVLNSLAPKGRKSTKITSLIEEFQYPKLGPGMMWEECAEKAQALGQKLHLQSEVIHIEKKSDRIHVRTRNGVEFQASNLISTMPINVLVNILEPPPPSYVIEAAERILHRDFLTVALIVPEKYSFADNWIYIHSPDVRVGRIQNYGSWSPYLVKEGRTCLGLEYFVSRGDDLWETSDEQLISTAKQELNKLNLVSSDVVEGGYVVRVDRAYPVYDANYAEALKTIREFLAQSWPGIHPVGRNGMHRYNNQDHSMLTAMLTVENIVSKAGHDVWSVNVEEDYHETSSSHDSTRGTGRSAPVLQ